MSKVTDLKKQIKELKSKLKKEAQAEFKVAFKDFFDQYPAVEAIHWEQYTPYFNDGDSCTFSVGYFWLEFKKTPEQIKTESEALFKERPDVPIKEWVQWLTDPEGLKEAYEEKEYASGDDSLKFTVEEKKAVKAFKKVWKDIVDDELFESLFGDHAQVKATRAGFKSTSYNDHD